MAKSTRKRRQNKPAKPRNDFPLDPHGNGQWAKKARGKRYFFGAWDDPEKAPAEWNRQKDAIFQTGAKQVSDDTRVTVKRLGDTYLTAKRRNAGMKCSGSVTTPGVVSRKCVGRSQTFSVSGRRPVSSDARDGLHRACWQ